MGVREHSVSLWTFINQIEILSQHLNCLYLPNKSVIWPSVAPMSLQLWEGYFLRWVQVGAVTTSIAERRMISEIFTRNKEAKQEAVRLRREVSQLLEEAVSLGLVSREEDGELDK